MLSTLFLAMMLGQCGPSGCPNPYRATMPTLRDAAAPTIQIVPAPAPAPHPRRWLAGVDRKTGERREVWGWTDDAGQLCFNADEQPARQRATSPGPLLERPPLANVEPPDPATPPGPAAKTVGAMPHYAVNGVDRARLDRAAPDSYSHAGEQGRKFIEQVKAATVEDDSGKPFITVIGTAAECRPVMEALRGPLATRAGAYHVREFRPTDPYVVGVGLPTAGTPSIVVQEARADDGTASVLHRQEDFAGGAVSLAEALDRAGAVRKPNPDYRPDKTPDLRKPEGEAGIPRWLVIAGVGCAVMIVTPKRKP